MSAPPVDGRHVDVHVKERPRADRRARRRLEPLALLRAVLGGRSGSRGGGERLAHALVLLPVLPLHGRGRMRAGGGRACGRACACGACVSAIPTAPARPHARTPARPHARTPARAPPDAPLSSRRRSGSPCSACRTPPHTRGTDTACVVEVLRTNCL